MHTGSVHHAGFPTPAELVAVFLDPKDSRAQRLLRHLLEDRLHDAERAHAALRAHRGQSPAPDQPTQLEELLLHALLLIHQGRRCDAESRCWQITALLCTCENDRRLRLLAAAALTLAGDLCRRAERLPEARTAHERAFMICEQHATPLQKWHIALGLSLDLRLARQESEADQWFMRTLRLAVESGPSADFRQAVAAEHFAEWLLESKRFDQAIGHARQALDHRRTYDPSRPDTGRTHLLIGRALLAQAETKLAAHPDAAGRTLDEAIDHLDAAHLELAAFGTTTAHDTQWAADQLDFAQRLRAMLGVTDE